MLSVAQLDERIERCLAILADNPHSQVFAALADAYRKRGELGRAFSVCKSGLKHHPDYAPAHMVMAKLYLHQNMHDDAMRSLRRAVAIDGKTSASEQLEAEILIGRREFERAGDILKRLQATDPGNPLLKGIESQLRQAMTPPLGTRQIASSQPVLPADKSPNKDSADSMTWQEWVDNLTSLSGVTSSFALTLTGNASMPISILAESHASSGCAATVSCASMFAAVDADTRAGARCVVEELRVEWDGGLVWCRRHQEHLIGFVGQQAVMFGAVRQRAIESAALVRGPKLSE